MNTPITDAMLKKPGFSPSEWIESHRSLETAAQGLRDALNRAFWIAEREAESAVDSDIAIGWQATAGRFAEAIARFDALKEGKR